MLTSFPIIMTTIFRIFRTLIVVIVRWPFAFVFLMSWYINVHIFSLVSTLKNRDQLLKTYFCAPHPHQFVVGTILIPEQTDDLLPEFGLNNCRPIVRLVSLKFPQIIHLFGTWISQFLFLTLTLTKRSPKRSSPSSKTSILSLETITTYQSISDHIESFSGFSKLWDWKA